MEPLFELKVTTAAPGSREVASHLFNQLKRAILDNRLSPGSRLPSTRDAPRVFGVSRNTAQEVYDRLAQENLLSSRHGSGTYVAQTRPTVVAPPSAPSEADAAGNPFWNRPDISAWMGFWHEGENSSLEMAPLADLRPALVDQRLFPHAAFRQVMARQLRRFETTPPSTRSAQGNQGNGQLRRAIAEHIGLTRAVACDPQDVIVTSGAQQAFDLVARALVLPGETLVAIEDPGYPPLRVPFAAAGARLAAVPVDGEGIVVDAIPTGAKIICVCPSHQFPLGMAMSPRRREALLRFAAESGAIIVEDDYDGEFRYDGSPLEALRGSASASRVFYIGSFSKCLFPGVRLGFIVPPAWALPALVAAKNATDWHSSVPVQAAVAGFMQEGHLNRHIRRVRRIYRDRRDALLLQLEQRLGNRLTVVPSLYGMHVAALATEGRDCEAISQALARRGIMIHALERYFMGSPTCAGFIIGYAAVDFGRLKIAVDELADEIAKQWT